jgi:hypothetical protein
VVECVTEYELVSLYSSKMCLTTEPLEKREIVTFDSSNMEFSFLSFCSTFSPNFLIHLKFMKTPIKF